MSRIVQFPDLTETMCSGFQSVEQIKILKKTYAKNSYMIPDQNFETEFVFGCAALGTKIDAMEDWGFKHITSMINWWPSHWNQNRELRFLWWKNPKGKILPDKKVKRSYWAGGEGNPDKDSQCTYNLASTGCGFKLGNMPLRRQIYRRFFTVLRLPLVLTEPDELWLKDNRFRFVDKGSIAQYYVNGWDPKEWSIQTELDFWAKDDPKNDLMDPKDRDRYGY